VAAFLQARPGIKRPSDKEIIEWVQMTLGKHKAPAWIFWVGIDGAAAQFPATGSGKIKKNELSAIGNRMLSRQVKL
jgi:hypothetical protein